MSNIEAYRQAKDVVLLCEAPFIELSDKVTWAKESRYALQALKSNDRLAGAALKSLDSLREAIVNVAAIGLTLNPVKKHAYLVPRGGKICLDVSYQGYTQMAIDSGIFSYIQAEIVYKNDKFTWAGIGEKPVHEIDFVSDRGDIHLAYCVAKKIDGDYITTIMMIDEIYAIRDRSQAWKSGFSPWKSDPGEMIKKTVIRRAWKSWGVPSGHGERIERAMDQDIDDINDIGEVTVTSSPEKEPLLETIREQLFLLDKTIEETVVFCGKLYQRKIESLEDLTKYETEKLVAMLDQRINKMEKEEIERKRKDYQDEIKDGDPSTTDEIPIELELETD